MTPTSVQKELQVAAQIDSKRTQNATWILNKKYDEKINPKMSNLGSKMGEFLGS